MRAGEKKGRSGRSSDLHASATWVRVWRGECKEVKCGRDMFVGCRRCEGDLCKLLRVYR